MAQFDPDWEHLFSLYTYNHLKNIGLFFRPVVRGTFYVCYFSLH